MSQAREGKPECRFCFLLESHIFLGKEYFRCQKGRYDDKYGKKYFIWGSIWRPKSESGRRTKGLPLL